MRSFFSDISKELGDKAALEFKDKASVSAVLWVEDKEDSIPELFYIQRAESETDRWSKQIGFPGGKQEGQESDQETAERETLEEVGFDLTKEAVFWGALDSVEGRKGGLLLGFGIYPFLYRVSKKPNVTPDPAEVGNTFWVSLLHLLDPKNDSDKLINFNGKDVHLPALEFPEGNLLWGLTYRMTHDLLIRLEKVGYIDHLKKITGRTDLTTKHFRKFVGG